MPVPPRTIRFLVGNPKLNFHLLRLHPRWGHRSNPIESVYGVYLRTFTIKNQPNVGKYTIPMDGRYNVYRITPFCKGTFLNSELLNLVVQWIYQGQWWSTTWGWSSGMALWLSQEEPKKEKKQQTDCQKFYWIGGIFPNFQQVPTSFMRRTIIWWSWRRSPASAGYLKSLFFAGSGLRPNASWPELSTRSTVKGFQGRTNSLRHSWSASRCCLGAFSSFTSRCIMLCVYACGMRRTSVSSGLRQLPATHVAATLVVHDHQGGSGGTYWILVLSVSGVWSLKWKIKNHVTQQNIIETSLQVWLTWIS